jgi:hypothetical protein
MGWSLWLAEGEEAVCERDRGYTHNTNKMIRAAGDGSSPYEWDGMAAPALAALLDVVGNELASKPEVYGQYDPPNGWGSRETLLPLLRAIADDCREFPAATVRMSC